MSPGSGSSRFTSVSYTHLNLSYRLDPELTSQYLDLTAVKRRIDIGFDASALRGELFLVTGTGKYFKNVAACPAQNLGIFRVAENGSEIELLWGYEDGGKPTSELPTHLLNHACLLYTS